MSTVWLVDDDAAIRDSLSVLLQTVEVRVRCFPSAETFLTEYRSCPPECLVLDLRMPSMNGLELQTELTRQGHHLPIIFLSAYGDVPSTVGAMKAGAADFLTKPIIATELLNCIDVALERSERQHRNAELTASLRSSLERLSERERHILDLALKGLQNKEIAKLLNISPRTVEVHRARVLEKTGTTNFLELGHALHLLQN